MRWLGIIALSLLALVPLCSSDGNQSNTTALPSANPLATNEIYNSSSLLNSTGTSTIMSDAEASPTASAIDPPIGNLSAVISVMQEETTSEQGSEIKYSSTHNTLELTPSREDDEDVKNDEKAASSEADDVEAEPSRSSGVESQPQSVESPPAHSANSSETENLTADNLLIQLNAANKTLEEAKEATAKERDELAKREKATEQPNKDYEEKKKEWEKLEAIAVEKETADREFKTASKDATEVTKAFKKAERELATTDEKLKQARQDKIDCPLWKTQLDEDKIKKHAKETEEKPLIDRITSLETDVTTKKDEWNEAVADAKIAQDTYDTDKCDEVPQSTSTLCAGLRTEIGRLNGLADQAKTEHDEVERQLNTSTKDLETLMNEITRLGSDIERIEKNMRERTDDTITVEISKLEEDFKSKNENYENAKTKKEEAEAELEKKKKAKELAEQSDGGLSSLAAKQAAMRAKAFVTESEKEKKKADAKVEDQKKILENAEQREAEAKANVEKLEKAYAEALKEEEARRREAMKTGSGVGLGVGLGLGGVLLLIGIALGVFFWCRHMKKKGNGPDDKKKPKKGGVTSRTPSTLTTSKASEAQPLLRTESSTNVQNTVGCGGSTVPVDGAPVAPPPTTPSRDAMAAPATASQSTPLPRRRLVYQCERNERPPRLMDPATTPFDPEDAAQHFVIPPRNFTWKGPLVHPPRMKGEPKHLLEGKKGPEKLEELYFDPNANTAVEIGPNEKFMDRGPASDSDRSEYLDRFPEWENVHNAGVAMDAAAAIKNPTRSQKEDSKNKKKKFEQADQAYHDKGEEIAREKEKAQRKRPRKDKKSKNSRSKSK